MKARKTKLNETKTEFKPDLLLISNLSYLTRTWLSNGVTAQPLILEPSSPLTVDRMGVVDGGDGSHRRWVRGGSSVVSVVGWVGGFRGGFGLLWARVCWKRERVMTR